MIQIPAYQVVNRQSMHFSPRGGLAVQYIVVHTTETPVNGTVEGTIDFLVRNDRGVSCHELVVPGRAVLMVGDQHAAHHAGSDTSRFPNGAGGFRGNAQSWGIELYRRVDTPISEEIVGIGIDRVALACQRLGLGVDRILAHRQVDPERRSDPVGVDIEEFREEVRARLGQNGHAHASREVLLAEGAARQVLHLNPEAALLRRIVVDGYHAVSDEFPTNGFIAQAAVHPFTGRRRTYYVVAGHFGEVRFEEAA